MIDRAQTLGETPRACPFVAFDDDRDRRADEPDHRHRCYAEPTPAPRAIAHQTAYCLSSGFATCPIFLDWAVRAAAEPVAPQQRGASPRPESGATGVVGSALTGAAASPAVPEERPTVHDAGDSRRRSPAGIERIPSTPEPTSAAGAARGALSSRDDAVDTWAAFAAAAPPTAGAMGGTVVTEGSPAAPGGTAVTGGSSSGSGRLPWDPAGVAVETSSDDAAPAVYGADGTPPFLASRDRGAGPSSEGAPALRPPAPQRPSARPSRPARAAAFEPPDWERRRRGDSFPTLRTRRSLVGVSPVLLGAIGLGLGALLLFLLPGFLADRPSAGGTPPAGGAASATPSAVPSASREPTPTPAPTPVTYVVRTGDTLSRIAKRFGLTVDQVVCANDLRNPDRLEVGQELVIPDDEFQCEATPGP